MKNKLLPLLSVALLCSSVITYARAGEVAKCEKRTSPARSKISVEVEDLKVGAVYTAIIKSGTKSVLSTKAANTLGKVRFGFDSNKKDILSGATAISPKLIVSDIDVLVTDAVGNIIAETDAVCRIR